jgi:Sucrose synthase
LILGTFFQCTELILVVVAGSINSFKNDCQDVAHEIAGEMQAIPDLIIGNYSDGNLVASLLAHKLGVTTVRFNFQPKFIYCNSKWLFCYKSEQIVKILHTLPQYLDLNVAF